MRLGLALIGLIAVCYAQYEQHESPVDNSDFFNCQGREDGNYGTDCSGQYYTCVNGEATARFCQDGLFFNQEADYCDYPPQHCFGEDSLNSETIVHDDLQAGEEQPEEPENLGYGQVIEDGIDCADKPDGFYSNGCSEVYTVCSFGSSTQTRCYPGLVFDQIKSRCTYPQDCGLPESTVAPVVQEQPAVPVYQSPETTTQIYASPVETTAFSPAETTAFSPVETTTPEASEFDCVGKADGIYNIGCVAEYYQCVAEKSFKFQCPSGLVFDSKTGRCEYSCGSAETTAAYETTTQFYTTQQPIGQEEPEVPTAVPTAVPTTIPSGCVDGDTSAFAQCSTKFRRCRNGKWIVSRCPGMTVFDETIGLCVYDLPRCKTTLFNRKSEVSVPSSSYGVSTTSNTYQAPAAAPVAASNTYQVQAASPVGSAPSFVPFPHFFQPAYVSNPFYAYRRDRNDRFRGHENKDWKNKGRHGKQREQKINKGKIAYKTRSPFVKGDREYVNDQFTGYRVPFSSPIFNKVFPTYNRKWRTTTAAPTTTTTPGQTNPSQATRIVSPDQSRLLSAPETNQVLAITPETEETIEGSGEESEILSRKKRSYGVTEAGSDATLTSGLCSNEVVGSLVSLGSCRQDFVYCESSANEVVAACPVGELFDETVRKCTTADFCGESGSVPSLPVEEVDNVVAGTTNQLAQEQALPVEEVDNVVAGNTNQLAQEDQVVVSQNSGSFEVPSQNYQQPSASNVAPAQTVENSVVASYGQEQLTTLAPSREGVKEEVQFDSCEGKIDGYFAVGCSTKYFICDNGRTIEMSCDHGLVFNERRIACDYKQNVQACDESSTAVETVNVQSDSGSVKPAPYKPAALDIVTASSKCVRDGFFPESLCSGRYYSCKDGVQVHTFACADGDVFSERYAACVSRTKAGCVSETVPYVPAVTVPTVAKPAQDFTTQQYETTVKPVRGYDAYATEASVIETTTELAQDTSCPVGPYSDTKCSATYKLCAGGLIHELNCPSGLVFHESRCEYPEFSGCESTIVSEAITTATTEAAYVSSDVNEESTVTSSYQTLETTSGSTSTASVTETASLTETASAVTANQVFESECRYGEPRSIAIGSCSNSYKTCTEEGQLINSNCDYGLVYDNQSGTCISSSSCVPQVNEDVPTTSVVTESTSISSAASVATPCSGKKDYETISFGECRDSFMRCINEAPITEHCAKNHVYSSAHGRCIRREKISECSENNIEYVVPSGNISDFCVRRRDGLYRNPKVCSGILQCFGGELYARPSCPAGLVFNEKNDQCDYRHNVPGCEDVSADPSLEDGCRGQKHGAYLADSTDCTVFYRCVWDRLEKMACPSGTVFNPVFSVCDWPANVPNCAGGSVISSTPAADEALENTTVDSNTSSEQPIRPY